MFFYPYTYSQGLFGLYRQDTPQCEASGLCCLIRLVRTLSAGDDGTENLVSRCMCIGVLDFVDRAEEIQKGHLFGSFSSMHTLHEAVIWKTAVSNPQNVLFIIIVMVIIIISYLK